MSDEHPTLGDAERADAVSGDDPEHSAEPEQEMSATDMVPEPPSEQTEEPTGSSDDGLTGEIAALASDEEPASDPSLTDQIAAIDEVSPEIATGPDKAPGDAPAAPAADEVPGLTAAEIPALEGCDVDKSWAEGETCEGTEAIEPVSEAEVDSGLEAAEGEEAYELAEKGDVETVFLSASPTWPFVVYLVLWAVLSVVAGWQLSQIPAGVLLIDTDVYRWTVIGGVVMTATGPILIVAVWLASWFRADETDSRAGMLSSALLKGSVVTLLGVVMWWGTLAVVDQIRIGRFL